MNVLSCYEWLALIYRDLGSPFEAEKYRHKAEYLRFDLEKLGLSSVERIVDY